MRVEHFMTKNPVVADVGQSVQQVASLMEDKGVGCVVILENRRLRGLVTDRDLATKVLAKGIPADTPVEEILPPRDVHPASVGVDDNVFAVVDTMRSGGVVRRLPVITSNAEVVGVVSIADIAVIAKDLVDAVLLEETHDATKNAKILTGAKSFVKEMRRPTKIDRLPPGQPTHTTTEPTPEGEPNTQGMAVDAGGKRERTR